MLKIIRRRVISMIPILVLATFISVAMIQLVPGDPALAILGDFATDERLASLRESLNLNESLPMQYFLWLADAVTGDLGSSLLSSEPVSEALARSLPVTLQVVGASVVFASVVGLTLGLVAAVTRRRRLDQFLTFFSTLGIAIPNFWLAIVLISVFSLSLGWLPATGFVSPGTDLVGSLRTTLLPAIALGASASAEVARQTRSALLEILRSDYIRTATAMGFGWRRTILKHALKNAGVPLATVLGLVTTRLLGATVVVESIFAIPGMGRMAVTAVLQRDFPIIRGVIVCMVIVVLMTNLLVDISYRIIDPRMRA